MRRIDVAGAVRSKTAGLTTLSLDAYHAMAVDALEPLLPVNVETV